MSMLVMLVAALSLATSGGSAEPLLPGSTDDARVHATSKVDADERRTSAHVSAYGTRNAQKTCDVEKTSKLVFLKFHQVGSETFRSFILQLLNLGQSSAGKYPLIDKLHDAHNAHKGKGDTKHRPVRIDHDDSADAVAEWITKDGGKVPDDVCAMTLLRDPRERFLSTFFKRNFDPGVDTGSSKASGNIGKNKELDLYLKDVKPPRHQWKTTFEIDTISKYFKEKLLNNDKPGVKRIYSEYSEKLSSVEMAEKVLDGFQVVALTENLDENFKQACTALHVDDDDCETAIAAAKSDPQATHHFPEHPTMSSYDNDVQTMADAWLADDLAIYEHVQERAGAAAHAAEQRRERRRRRRLRL